MLIISCDLSLTRNTTAKSFNLLLDFCNKLIHVMQLVFVLVPVQTKPKTVPVSSSWTLNLGLVLFLFMNMLLKFDTFWNKANVRIVTVLYVGRCTYRRFHRSLLFFELSNRSRVVCPFSRWNIRRFWFVATGKMGLRRTEVFLCLTCPVAHVAPRFGPKLSTCLLGRQATRTSN